METDDMVPVWSKDHAELVVVVGDRDVLAAADDGRAGARAELAGAEPEKLLEPGIPTPAPGKLDPGLVSAYINASFFAFGRGSNPRAPHSLPRCCARDVESGEKVTGR